MGLLKTVRSMIFGQGGGGFISTSPGLDKFYPELDGAYITAGTAFQVPTVYACINCIAGAIKSMPLKIYKQDSIGKIAVNHPYFSFLNKRASEDWTASDAWVYIIKSKFLYGDGYAQLIRADYRSSIIKGWKPLHPYLVTPYRDKDGVKRYKVLKKAGGSEFYIVDAADMIQITSLGYDGLTSPSTIQVATDVLKTAVAGQKWQSRFFTSGANFDYVLSSDRALTGKQTEDLRKSIMESYSKDGGPLVLSSGIKPMSLTINPRDAELLSSRKFTMEEICLAFTVPLIMLGYSEKNTSWGSGIGVIGQQFVKLTLLPHLEQIKEEFESKLWPDHNKFSLRHDTSELERGDQKSRYESYRIALGRAGEPGWMTINEIRALENMYPVEWGDEPIYTGKEEKKDG